VKPKGKAKKEEKRVKTIRKCKFCGGSHEYKKQKCPAYGQTCDKCKEENHFAACCPPKRGNSKNKRNPKKVHALQGDDSTFEDDSDGEVVYSVSGTSATTRKYVAAVEFINKGQPVAVQCQLDTGASRNTMALETYRRITGSAGNLRRSSTRLRTYDGTIMLPVGYDRLQVHSGNTTLKVHVEVVQDAPVTLLSGNTCERLKLIQVNEQKVMHVSDQTLSKDQVMKDYKDVFTGLGKIGTLSIKTDPSVQPVQNHSRRVPVALQQELKAKLADMEQSGIITRVHTPTKWINNMVAVKTPSKLKSLFGPSGTQ